MRRSRRRFNAVLTSIAAGSALGNVGAQDYPNRPIRLIVPYSAGGGIDFIARNVGIKMSERLGQQIIVDNRPGASSIIGAETVARAPGDGYTLLIGDSTTFAVNPSLYTRLSYDPQRDFAMVSLAARFTMMIVVNPQLVEVSTLQELLKEARKRPGQISYGSAGAGTPHHLGMELLQQQAGITLNHVAYKGGAPALQDLLAGQVGVILLDLPTATPHLKNPRLRILASATSEPVASLHGVPTASQAGLPGFQSVPTIGIATPVGTSSAIVERLNASFIEAIDDNGIRAKMIGMGMEPIHSTSAEMAEFMRNERKRWAEVIRKANIALQ